jgi:hypothetical protein
MVTHAVNINGKTQNVEVDVEYRNRLLFRFTL